MNVISFSNEDELKTKINYGLTPNGLRAKFNKFLLKSSLIKLAKSNCNFNAPSLNYALLNSDLSLMDIVIFDIPFNGAKWTVNVTITQANSYIDAELEFIDKYVKTRFPDRCINVTVYTDDVQLYITEYWKAGYYLINSDDEKLVFSNQEEIF